MSTRARSLSELWNDPKQDEVLFVLQVIPDKRDAVIPGGGIYGVIITPRFQDLVEVQPGKIYVALDTGQIKFLDAGDKECHVTLPQEIHLRSLTGDEHSDSPKRRQVQEDIFNVARAHGYPFDITQEKISQECRNRVREAGEINKMKPRLIPIAIVSPNTAVVYSDTDVPLEQFDPSLYTKRLAKLFPVQENAGIFRLHFSSKKRDDIIAQTKTRKDLWSKTEVALGVYHFQVTAENGIEIKDPAKDEYFPLYYKNKEGQYKICEQFYQMNLKRIEDIKKISLQKSEIETKSLSQEDKYKQLWAHNHHARDGAFKKILDDYKNRIIPLSEEIEARHAEQMRRYKERFEIIKRFPITALEKRQHCVKLKESLELFLAQERSGGIEEFSSLLYDSLCSRVEILMSDSINPEIERLGEEISRESLSSSSLCSIPEPMYQTGHVAQVNGYAECFQKIIESEASILKKLQQLRCLKEDLTPFISAADDKSPLQDGEPFAKKLMTDLRKALRELRQIFRHEIIQKLVSYLGGITGSNEKNVIIKLLIHLRSRADIPLMDVTEEENYFMIHCSSLYLNALKEDDLSAVLDEADKTAFENEGLLDFLTRITVEIPELREMLLTQIIHSTATALQKMQRLNRLQESIRSFKGEDPEKTTTMALIRVAIDQCRDAFLNLDSIKSLERFLRELDLSDCKSETRITFLGWSTQVPIPSTETKMAETESLKTVALKILTQLKLWVRTPHIRLSEAELEMVHKNTISLKSGTLLDSLTAEEQEALEDSELQSILAGIVGEVPELEFILCGRPQNAYQK